MKPKKTKKIIYTLAMCISQVGVNIVTVRVIKKKKQL